MKSRTRKKKKGLLPVKQRPSEEIPRSSVRDMALITGLFLSMLIVLCAIGVGIGLHKRYSKASKKIEYRKKQ